MGKISWMLKIKNCWLTRIRWVRVDLDIQHDLRNGLQGLRLFIRLVEDDQIKAGLMLNAKRIQRAIDLLVGD